jgi:hypothetical protein
VRVSGRKRYNNPFIGLITLDYETFTLTADPGQTMFIFHAEPDSDDARSLFLLARIADGDQAGREATGRSAVAGSGFSADDST